MKTINVYTQKDFSDGKIRTSELRVLREVPLEELGAYGKIVAKKRKKGGVVLADIRGDNNG